MQDIIYRQAAIDSLDVGAELLRRVLDDADIVGVERAMYEWGLGLIESYISDIKELPSAQPEYYDYSDIDDVWEYYAKEQDIKLTDGAKQLKDAMWVGYRKGKQVAQPEIVRCVDCIHRDKFPKGADNDMPLKCLGIRYGGVMPDWYCEHGKRRTDE